MKIIKQVLQFEECLKQRLEFICEFSKVTPTFINGSIRKLERTTDNLNRIKDIVYELEKQIAPLKKQKEKESPRIL